MKYHIQGDNTVENFLISSNTDHDLYSLMVDSENKLFFGKQRECWLPFSLNKINSELSVIETVISGEKFYLTNVGRQPILTTEVRQALEFKTNIFRVGQLIHLNVDTSDHLEFPIGKTCISSLRVLPVITYLPPDCASLNSDQIVDNELKWLKGEEVEVSYVHFDDCLLEKQVQSNTIRKIDSIFYSILFIIVALMITIFIIYIYLKYYYNYMKLIPAETIEPIVLQQ